MSFQIEYDKQPARFLKHLDKPIRKRIVDKLESVLERDPIPHNAISIVGGHGVFRIRIGIYRVIYRINYEKRKIVIAKVDKRPRVYH